MKYFIAILSLMFFFSTAAQAQEKLYLYTWDTYIAPDLFKKFEKETGIEVITDIYSNNDTLVSKLKAGSAYDIVMPSGNYMQVLIQQKQLLPLPADLRDQFAPQLGAYVQHPSHDPDYAYSIPYFFGTTGIAVNKKLIKEDITSWQSFFKRPAGEAASIGILDDISTAMNLGSLAIEKPFCQNSPETFKSLQNLFVGQKPFVKVYGSAGYTERMASGEIAMQMAWSCDAFRARQQNPDITYIYPKEGVEVWIDSLAIPATAKNVPGAKKFIAFMMRPENMAEAAIVSGNIPAIPAALDHLPESMRKAPEFNIPAGLNTKIAEACPTPVIQSYNKIWERLMR